MSELFEGSLQETGPILRNMDTRALQQLKDDRDRLEQKAREMEESLGLALQAMQRLETITQGMENGKPKGEPEKATIVLMEDNLTKAKRALMTPKQLCPTAAVVQAIENKVNPGEQDAEKLAKLKETLIKKTREYSKSFPKYNRSPEKDRNGALRSVIRLENIEWIQLKQKTLRLRFSEQSRIV